MCSGTLNVTNGTIIGNGTDSREEKTGDGLIPDGSAISIVDRNYPKGDPSASITGATITGAIRFYIWSNNSASDKNILSNVDSTKTYSIQKGESGWIGLDEFSAE